MKIFKFIMPVVGAVMIMLLASCTRKIYVPVEREWHEQQYQQDSTIHIVVRADTLLRIDSVRIEQRGDTLFHNSWRIIERIRYNNDTVYVGRRDTVYIRSVVQKHTPTPTAANRTAPWSMLLGAIMLLIILLIIHRRLRKHQI